MPQGYYGGAAALAPLPGSMRKAIGLMYAGAGYTLVYAVGVVIVASAIIAKHPLATAARTGSGHITLGGVAALAVVAALIEVAAWLGIARACRNGRTGARITGTVLFGLHTIGLLGVLANTHPGLGLAEDHDAAELADRLRRGGVLVAAPVQRILRGGRGPAVLTGGIPCFAPVLHNGHARRARRNTDQKCPRWLRMTTG